MKSAVFLCRCCKGEWRGRVDPPHGRDTGGYLVIWGAVETICGRCNNGDCSRPDSDRTADVGCNEGRKGKVAA